MQPSLKTDKRFSLSVLLITAVMVLSHGTFRLEGMNADVFAINYRHGFVARGLPGAFLDLVCAVLGDKYYTYNTVLVIYIVFLLLYFAVLWFLGKKLIRAVDRKEYAMTFVMMFTPFFVEMFISFSNTGRTDMFLIVLSVIAGYAVMKEKALILCVICPAIGVMIHEGYIMDYYNIVIACLLYKIIFSEGKKRTRYLAWFGASVCCTAILVTWLFALSKVYFPVSQETYDEIVANAEILTSEGGYTHYQFLNAEVLGTDLYDSEAEFMALALTELPLFLICFMPLFIKGYKIIKRIVTATEFKKTAIVLCMGPLSLVPLFVRKCDYGRWLFAFITYYVVVMALIIISGNKTVEKAFEDEAESTMKNGWEGVFLAMYLMLFVPFRTIYVSGLSKGILNLIARIVGL